MLLAVCPMVGLLPVSALAAENDTYQITTDIESQTFIVGQETEFSVTTNVADDAGTKTVRGYFEVNDSNDNPVTSADITPWIALILVSVMSMTAAVIIRRKKR